MIVPARLVIFSGLAALMLSGAVQMGVARASSAAASGAAKQGPMCEVTIDRSQPAGTYDVTRQELENGDCICYVYTGPQPQSDSIEGRIAELQRTRECSDARPLAAAGPESVTGRGILGGAPILPLLGLGGAGAAAAALSTGPASP